MSEKRSSELDQLDIWCDQVAFLWNVLTYQRSKLEKLSINSGFHRWLVLFLRKLPPLSEQTIPLTVANLSLRRTFVALHTRCAIQKQHTYQTQLLNGCRQLTVWNWIMHDVWCFLGLSTCLLIKYFYYGLEHCSLLVLEHCSLMTIYLNFYFVHHIWFLISDLSGGIQLVLIKNLFLGHLGESES